MSSLILIAHVKDGVEIAQKNKLGQAIIDTIQQHHGTSLISYFSEKAKQLKGEENVKIEDFRYPGPKPADQGSRPGDAGRCGRGSLAHPGKPHPGAHPGTWSSNLINKVFSDGQLDSAN